MSTSPIIFPKSYEELEALPHTSVLYQAPDGGVKVVVVAPEVLIKYRGPTDLSEELKVVHFVRNTLSLPVPKTIRHSPLRRRQPLPTDRHIRGERRYQVWYICMERCPGVSLDQVISTMSSEELHYISEQLKDMLAQMASVRSSTFGSVTGGPYRNYFFPRQVTPKYAFKGYGEFMDYFRTILMYFCTASYTEQFLSNFPRHSPSRFTHGDLLPRNIIVDGSTITGIIDWGTGGFYPEFWEYARMHGPTCNLPNWDYVLSLIFSGPRRQQEIDAVSHLISMLVHNM